MGEIRDAIFDRLDAEERAHQAARQPKGIGGPEAPTDRIAALEARVATLEAWIETLRKMDFTAPQPAVQPTQGCVCPVGAEAVCRAAMCPRRPWVVT